MRKANDFLACCVPVALVIPIWTYSQYYDRVILLTPIIFLSGRFFTTRRLDSLTLLGCLYLLLRVFMQAWDVVFAHLNVLDPTGIGWICRLAEYSSYAVMLAIAALFVRDSRRPTPPAAVRLS